jgi:protein tyrosine/serine phosphatase
MPFVSTSAPPVLLDDAPAPRAAWPRWVLSMSVLFAASAGGLVSYTYYLRVVRARFDTVVPGQVYRSGQPTPAHLREWTRRYGLRTVINLRGADAEREAYLLERNACREMGLTLIDIEWSALRQPGREAVRALLDALDSAERPILIHCAHGVDRSGVASAIAAMRIGGADYETARRQIGSKYARLDADAPGVVGLLRRYEEACRARGRDPGAWSDFEAWLSSR